MVTAPLTEPSNPSYLLVRVQDSSSDSKAQANTHGAKGASVKAMARKVVGHQCATNVHRVRTLAHLDHATQAVGHTTHINYCTTCRHGWLPPPQLHVQ